MEILYFMIKVISFVPICITVYIWAVLILPFLIPNQMLDQMFDQEEEDNTFQQFVDRINKEKK